MERGGRWFFTREQLADTPSRRAGMEADREARYRRQAVNFIRHVGQKLALPQLWINTASILMHRFFMYQSFTRFDRNVLSLAVLFCVAKSFKEEDGRIYPEPFLKTAHSCLYRDLPPLDSHSPQYEQQLEDLLFYEYVLLATLGFDLDIDHAHTHILKNSHLVTATTALTKVAHDIASRSLEFTTMCLQYKPTAVACFCLQLACQWANWEIPPPKDGKPWFHQVDETLTQDLINHLLSKFRHNVGGYYPHLQEKIMSFCYKNSPVTPHPSPSHSPWREPPKVHCPLPSPDPSCPLAGSSGPPNPQFPPPQPHPRPFQRPPDYLHPPPPPHPHQKDHQSPPDPSKPRPLPRSHHQRLQNSSKNYSPAPGHHHRHHQKPPNPLKSHSNAQNPPGHHHRHHLEHHQKSADLSYLNSPIMTPDIPEDQRIESSGGKIVSSMTPGAPVIQPNLEAPDDLLEMAPPDNFDFEHTFMNVMESLTSITKPDTCRLDKSDGGAGGLQEVPSMPSGVDSIDSGVFSQSLSQPLSQGNIPQGSDSQLKRKFEAISGKNESFSSIFDPPDDVDEAHLEGLDDNDNDLSRSDRKRKRKKDKHKRERRRERKEKERAERERAVSPITLKIPREKLGNFGDDIDKGLGEEGAMRRKRQREDDGEVEAKRRYQGD
ncbi:cyclin-T [Diachasma alloeum]|uniref:cyclin-T n=1 Tax=Diachasma alloeum TaxID=454923 RepID=UPI0007383298|nr:cyclin-T [Diachasma alloeum]